MRAIASLSVLVLFPALAFPEETLRTFSWKERGEKADYVVVSSDSAPRTVTILTVSDPGVRRSRYAIEGQVRYEDVAGVAYLEMWNFFPQARYFSRTLDVAGPLQNLQGSSDWRPFVLPFYNKVGGPPPQQLVVNVVLPGRGTVEVGPLRLVQFGDDEDPLVVKRPWWSGRTGGLVGGLTGALLGCLGARSWACRSSLATVRSLLPAAPRGDHLQHRAALQPAGAPAAVRGGRAAAHAGSRRALSPVISCARPAPRWRRSIPPPCRAG